MLLILLSQLALLLGAVARSPVHPSKETFFHGFINDSIPSIDQWPDPRDIGYQHVTLSGWRSTEVVGVSYLPPLPPLMYLH